KHASVVARNHTSVSPVAAPFPSRKSSSRPSAIAWMLVSFSKAYRLRARCVSSSRRIMSALRSAALTRVLGRIAGAGSASFAGPAALPAPCRLRSLLILLTSAIRTLLGIQRVQHLDDLIEHSLVPVKFIVDRGPIGPLNSGT